MLLITVVKTWGSSSRPEDAMLALRNDGVVISSVSGGCIEDSLIDRVRREGLHYTKPEVVRYSISTEEARRFGLPCSGTLQLVLEPLNTSSRIDALLRAVEAGQLVVRMLGIAADAATLQHTTVTDGLQFDEAHLVAVRGSRYRMPVIGAGQLLRHPCQIVVGLGYQIAVYDPREEYSGEWLIPDVAMVHTMPDDTVIAMELDERCAVITLTRDPKLNDLALMEVLKAPAFYVGAFGNRRNNTNHRERLRRFDLSDAELTRLHGPVDIYIGSRAPPEIAISILAEAAATKSDVSLPTILQIKGTEAAREITASTASNCTVPQS